MKTLPPSDAARAACAGQFSLFDSRRIEDHIQARALCNTCPIFAACWDQLQDVLNADANMGGSPEGTWAGRLYGKAELPPRRVNCGTDAGYNRHRHFQEKACDPCRLAHAAKSREQTAAARARREAS